MLRRPFAANLTFALAVLTTLAGCATKTIETLDDGDDGADSQLGNEEDPTDAESPPGEDDPTGDEDPPAPDTGSPADMGSPSCTLPFNDPLNPSFGDPLSFGAPCPVELSSFVQFRGAVDGDWRVSLCDANCESCEQTEHSLGAAPLELDAVLDGDANCYYLEAESLIAEEPDRCIYGSLALSLGEGGPGEPVFAAVRDAQALPPHAAMVLDDWQPILDGAAECDCGVVDPNEYPCCDNYMQIFVWDLVGVGIFAPGENANIELAGIPYTFYGQQAHRYASCELELEVSWALVRNW